jgi:hypothetical protein
MSEIPPVVLEQLAGMQRRIEWGGKLHPMAPAAQSVSQRVLTDLPPGAVEPIIQVLGPEEGPQELNGFLRDAWTPSGEEGSALELVERMKAFVREGYSCRLTWGTTWDRVVVPENLDVRWLYGEGRYEWRMRFVVLSVDGERVRDTRDVRPSRTTMQQRGAEAETLADAILATQQSYPR